ncbi:MAG: DUF177 domain-containing protein [Candidatus Aminicenantes bacterium]|nr:DUF177 domain-containing protein [Candidatus Aminicenantes bacterium]MCJ7488503.1 DUF177 domain-containing protein [Candidatus Aminicenantes bacterium]TFG57689.1 MAG: DUF177 domain-containing protein [Candidatus Aminicenantes bacterium]
MDTTMLIDIDRLPKEGLCLSRDFEFLSLDLVEENVVFLEPAHAEIAVRPIGEEILVRGEITARLSFVCSRCLTPFEFPVASKFDLVYFPEEIDVLSDELSDEKIDQMYYSGRQLDLQAVVLEQLNLTFPAKPLCAASCEGLCTVCGELIRDAKCSCLVKESDPRWNKIKFNVRDKS